jgi:PPM family protein phosphatase
MLDVEFAELSDAGLVREHNEDSVGHFAPTSPSLVRTHGWLFALADGVGGQAKGEVASRTAVESVLTGFASAPAGEPHSALLPRLLQRANTLVYETGRAASPGGVAMATTFVACSLRFDRLVVAHVGDSRCYLIRRGNAAAMTRDHTVAGEQARMGLLSAKEAAEAPTRHVLSRSLGNDLFVNVETNETQVYVGDVLLQCSDGMHGTVTSSDIAALITDAADLESAAFSLVDLAKRADGSDNISVQLIRIRGVERVGMYRGRPYRLR